MRKLHGDTEYPNPNVCFCSSKPPAPDPAIGAAASANAAIGQQQVDLAKHQMDINQENAAWQNPLIKQIAQQQIDSSTANTARADDQWNQYKTVFQPIENQMASDAVNFDSPARQDQVSAAAGADVTNAYGGALASNQRNMERMGVNPNSGKFQAINNETNIAQAKDTAGAMNTARNNTITQGMALRQGAAGFGRNMPNSTLAAGSLALNGGNAAVGNIAAGSNIANAGNSTASGIMGNGASAYSSSGNLGLGQYQGQLNSWNQENQNNMMGLGGLGSLFGQAGSAGPGSGFAKMFGGGGAAAAGGEAGMAELAMLALRKGGVIKNFRPHMSGGLNSLNRKSRIRMPGFSSMRRYGSGGLVNDNDGDEGGGMIAGAGTGDSDSIPAQINGGPPIRVSNGEAVLNKSAVDLVGEDFVHRINAGGLAMLNKGGNNV